MTHTNVDQLSRIAEFGKWLQERGHIDEAVAVAIRDRQKKLAFATLDDTWTLDLKSPAGPIALGVLRTQLVDQAQLKFRSRNLSWDLQVITKFLAPSLGMTERALFDQLAPAFIGDLWSASRCVNQDVTPPSKFKQVEQDAFEVALLCPQYETGIAPYYTKVGMPLAKLSAEGRLFAKPEQRDWFVTYPQLWLRVLTHYTGDPTLQWAFHENHDPYEAVAKLLKTTPDVAQVILLWQACGRDMDVFTRRFAPLVSSLPEDLTDFGQRLDRSLPALCLTTHHMQQAYWETRSISTLYGRRLRPGAPMGEAVAFRVFGTTEDLIGIAAATFWNNRPSRDILITALEGGPSADIIRICGTGPKEQTGLISWMSYLKQLSPLANPIQVSLNPIVTSLH